MKLPDLPLRKPAALLLLCFIAQYPGEAYASDMCMAANAKEFRACVKSANSGKYDGITIVVPITCDDSANLCQFTLSGIVRSFVIQGISNSQAGFHRSGEHGGYLHNTLTIQNSSGPILVQNFVFDEGKNQPLPYDYVASHDPSISLWTNQISSTCQAHEPPLGKTYLNPCPGNSLRITSSSNITIENIQFREAKNFGIQIDTSSSNITIKDSTFVDAWFNAIWSQNNGSIRGLNIIHNKFLNNRSNALEISAVAPQASDLVPYNTVIDNLFENNHNTGLFYQSGCHGIGNVCGGGQLLILSKSTDFQIRGNEIRNGGGADTYIAQQHNDVRGIEIDNTGIRNLIVTHNDISDNSGPAIDIAYNKKMSPLAYNIRVFGNKFVDNDAMNGGSPFNNEWFLNSGQNAENNGELPKDACEYVPAPPGTSCNIVPSRKPFDWGNSGQY